MNRFYALILTLALLLTISACGPAAPAETTAPAGTTVPAETTAPAETQPNVTVPAETVENPITFFTVSMGESFDAMRSINAYDDGFGKVYVEYVGDIKKVGTFDPAIFHTMTVELEKSGLAALNGQSVWEEGEKIGSMYVQFADGSYYSCDFSGTIPQEFTDGYAVMDAWFAQLTESLPEYVPQPMVMGEVDEALLSELMGILNTSGMEYLDTYTISQIPMDESFAFMAGLTGTDGITGGAACSPMMITTAYSLVIVTVEDESKIDAVRADFANNINWAKWVCVSASEAMIAQKGNMVICLMGSEGLYAQTASAITENGWTNPETFSNPNM